MRRLSCSLLTGVLLIGSLSSGRISAQVQTPAKPDDYWNKHWSWYDSTYRPYYSSRRYRNWQPGPYSTRVAPYPGERSVYVPGPSGGRDYNLPAPVPTAPLRYGWW